MTRSKVIGGQIVIVMVALFQIAPAWTGLLRLQPNLDHRCTMGAFTLWRTSRSHDKVKGHWRSIVTVIWRQIVIVMVALFRIAPAWTGSLRLQLNLNHRYTMRSFMFDILQGDMTRSKVILTFTCLKMYIARSGDTSGSRTTLLVKVISIITLVVGELLRN